MKTLDLNDVVEYVENRIKIFHDKRIASLDDLKLLTVLKRKNPYLFKAKNVLTAYEIVRGIIEAHISSNEETVFGDWLENLAIFINEKVYGGKKSGITGIDLEFDHNHKRYIVSIKSGPNWGNAGQIKKMKTDFTTAKKTLRTSNSQMNIVAVNGCCYGKCRQPDKGNYFKYCGQQFWEFISGNANLYTEIIEPLGHKAKERNDQFLQSRAQRINKFTMEFAENYCKESGAIDWEKLVKFNSSASTSKTKNQP